MSAVSKSVWGRFLQPMVSSLTKSSRNNVLSTTRCLSTTPVKFRDSDDEGKGGNSWFGRLRKTVQPKDVSHSMALSSKETVYEIQFHAVKPEYMEEYLSQFSTFQNLLKEKGSGAELVGSFTVEIGEQDEAVHIWQYKGGYPVLNESNILYRTDADFKEFRKHRNQMLRYRKNQILLAFSFWPKIEPRAGNHIYELRSYTLKPGTMYEWGNCWAKGIRSRDANNEAVAGFFAQIGNVYNVKHLWDILMHCHLAEKVWRFFELVLKAKGLQYRKADSEPVAGLFSQIGEQNLVEHLWGYDDLQTRKETREAAWSRPGWDECVHYTVPLIRHMKSRILIPTPFSPLQ